MALVNKQQILDLYRKGDYLNLSKLNLATPIDADENTIIHIIATNLDMTALENLAKYNEKFISSGIINKPNKNSDTPLHLALNSLEKHKSDDHSIITYMIKKLHADPTLPNDNDVIVDSMTTETPFSSENKIMTKTIIVKNVPNKSAIIDFIYKLTDKYAPIVKGGYSNNSTQPRYNSHRTINDNIPYHGGAKKLKRTFNLGRDSTDATLSSEGESSDTFTESGLNDSFNLTRNPNRHAWENFSNERPRRDPEVTARFNSIVQKIMENMDIDEKKAKLYRDILKLYLEEQNPELKGVVNDALKIKEIEKLVDDKKKFNTFWEKKVSPEADRFKAIIVERVKLYEEKNKAKGALPTKEPNHKSKKPIKKNRTKKSETSSSLNLSGGDSETDEFFDTTDNGDDSPIDLTDNDDAFTVSDRPKPNTELNKRYYGILEKIIKYMNLSTDNDAEARDARTVIKYNVMKLNPELNNPDKTWEENEKSRLDKLEEIVVDKNTFEKYWNNISTKDKNAIRAQVKKQIETREKERAERGDKPRKEKDNRNGERPKRNRNETSSLGISSVSSSEESDEKPKKKTEKKVTTKAVNVDNKKKPSNTSSDKPKKLKKTKVVENGYIRSDELLFSSEDDY